MNKKDRILALIETLKVSQGEIFEVNEESLLRELDKDNTGHSGLAIKVLSVFGGFLATLLFLGFLMVAGLYESEAGLIFFGSAFVIGAIAVNLNYNRLIVDTASISVFVIGFVLLGLGFAGFEANENLICLLFIFIALATLCIVKTYMLSFISVLIVNGSFLALVLINEQYELVHLFVFVVVLIFAGILLNEARLIGYKRLAALYNPVRAGMLLSLLFSLLLLAQKHLLPMEKSHFWFSSPAIILVVVYLASQVMQVLGFQNKVRAVLIYLVTILILSLTAASPAISGAIFIMLVCFLVNYRAGFGLGILFFIYFISQFYYDLKFTLLLKSGILIATGFLFMALYLFTRKKLGSDETI